MKSEKWQKMTEAFQEALDNMTDDDWNHIYNNGVKRELEHRNSIQYDHKLKCLPQYFSLTWDGKKDFEIRKNDRNFQVGQTVLLREYNSNENTFTGREIVQEIVSIVEYSDALKDDYVVLGVRCDWRFDFDLKLDFVVLD